MKHNVEVARRKPLLLATDSAGLIGGKVVEAFAKDWQVVGLDVKKSRQPPAEYPFFRRHVGTDKGGHQKATRKGNR